MFKIQSKTRYSYFIFGSSHYSILFVKHQNDQKMNMYLQCGGIRCTINTVHYAIFLLFVISYFIYTKKVHVSFFKVFVKCVFVCHYTCNRDRLWSLLVFGSANLNFPYELHFISNHQMFNHQQNQSFIHSLRKSF